MLIDSPNTLLRSFNNLAVPRFVLPLVFFRFFLLGNITGYPVNPYQSSRLVKAGNNFVFNPPYSAVASDYPVLFMYRFSPQQHFILILNKIFIIGVYQLKP